ncbi:MAG: sigma-70 family RNA polymerase sigma factor [Planctomycetaceae bacterium]|nr:sigma-70 family RNA polymerase sigma factor [Planctomycetaceae bacterium]MBL4886627.1 sigma-70 family RNA polymerase sigma factor [Planctomycetaceae bacterium]
MWPTTQPSLLIKLRKTSNEAAWTDFVAVYYPLIKRVCLRHGLKEIDAEDVCQNVFRDLHIYLPKFQYDPQKGRFRSWLIKSVEHEVYRKCKGLSKENYSRERSGDNHHLLVSQAGKCESEFITGMHELILKTGLENIKPLYTKDKWQAFEQTWLEEIEDTKVASALNKKVTWVRMWKSKIKHRLIEEVRALAQDMGIAENV